MTSVDREREALKGIDSEHFLSGKKSHVVTNAFVDIPFGEDKTDYADKFKGCMVGGVIGDAFGRAVGMV